MVRFNFSGDQTTLVSFSFSFFFIFLFFSSCLLGSFLRFVVSVSAKFFRAGWRVYS